MLVLLALLVVWSSVTDGGVVDLGFAELSIRRPRNPLNLLIAGIVVDLWLHGTIQAVLREAWERLRRASLLRRVGMLISLIAGGPLLLAYLRLPDQLPAEGLRYEGLFGKPHSPHLTNLVHRVVSRPDNQPPVVYIEGGDPRGHYASFYCYPRAFGMEPTMRRWSILSAQVIETWDRQYLDPLLGRSVEAPAPDIQLSRDWAAALGTELLVVTSEPSGSVHRRWIEPVESVARTLLRREYARALTDDLLGWSSP